MLRVRDIMTEDVAALPSGATLREAVELLTDRHLSGAPVMQGSRVVGVLSMSDILQFLAEQTVMPVEQDAGEELDTTDEEVPAIFFQLPPDDVELDVGELLERQADGSSDPLGARTVDEVMTGTVLSVTPETTVAAASDFMQRTGVHRLLVMSEGKLKGLVSTMDIVRAVADHRLDIRRLVFASLER